MKYPILFSLCAILAGTVYAQEATAPAAPATNEPAAQVRDPAADRARVEDARRKAMVDPAVVALREKADKANREFREALQAKIKEIDPNAPDFSAPRPERPMPPQLTEDERTRLTAARRTAMESPKLKAASELLAQAKTPEEMQAAREAHMKAMREAIVEADPTLKDVVEKAMPMPPARPGN